MLIEYWMNVYSLKSSQSAKSCGGGAARLVMGQHKLEFIHLFIRQHYKDIPSPKQPVIHNGKVASPHGTSLILHESTPGLARRTRFPYFRYIFLNGSFAHY